MVKPRTPRKGAGTGSAARADGSPATDVGASSRAQAVLPEGDVAGEPEHSSSGFDALWAAGMSLAPLKPPTVGYSHAWGVPAPSNAHPESQSSQPAGASAAPSARLPILGSPPMSPTQAWPKVRHSATWSEASPTRPIPLRVTMAAANENVTIVQRLQRSPLYMKLLRSYFTKYQLTKPNFIKPMEDTPEAAAAKRAARTRVEEALREGGARGQRGGRRAAMTPAARAMLALTEEGAAHATRDESELEAFMAALISQLEGNTWGILDAMRTAEQFFALDDRLSSCAHHTAFVAEAQRILEAEKPKPVRAASRAAAGAHSAVTVHVAAPRAAAAKGKAPARHVKTEQSEDEDDSDDNQVKKAPKEVSDEEAALFCMSLGHEAATQKQFTEKFKPKLEELKAKMMSRTNGSKAKLPVQASKTLKLWFEQNLLWPYPEEECKKELLKSCGIERLQLDNWLINQRKRHWAKLFHPDQGVAKHGKEAVEAALLARWKTVAGVKKAYKDIYP